MTRESRRIYVLQCAAFFTFFLTWSSAFALFPIWLNQALGLGGKASGVIFSVNAVAGLFVLPLYGFVQDRFGLKKHLLYLVAFGLVLTGPFFVFAYQPLLAANLLAGALVGGLYFAVTFGAGVGALETYVERCSRAAGFEFGKARMWGSLGWAAASFYAGTTFNLAPQLNFWIATASGAAFAACIVLMRPVGAAPVEGAPAAPRVHLAEVFELVRTPRFWGLATFVMGVSCVYSVYDQQFPVYFASLFPTRETGNAMYGYLNSLQVFLEAGGMFLAPFLVNRIGAKHGLLLCGVIMAVRMIGSGLSDGAVEISAMKLLHAVELPIMIVSLFKYISATFDPRLSSTLYLVGFQFMSQVAASGLSVAAGAMYDAVGFAPSYIVLGSIAGAFVLVSGVVLANDRPSRRARRAEARMLPRNPFDADAPLPQYRLSRKDR